MHAMDQFTILTPRHPKKLTCKGNLRFAGRKEVKIAMISSKAGADVLCTAELGRCIVHCQDRKVYGVLCTARPRTGRCIVHC